MHVVMVAGDRGVGTTAWRPDSPPPMVLCSGGVYAGDEMLGTCGEPTQGASSRKGQHSVLVGVGSIFNDI